MEVVHVACRHGDREIAALQAGALPIQQPGASPEPATSCRRVAQRLLLTGQDDGDEGRPAGLACLAPHPEGGGGVRLTGLVVLERRAGDRQELPDGRLRLPDIRPERRLEVSSRRGEVPPRHRGHPLLHLAGCDDHGADSRIGPAAALGGFG